MANISEIARLAGVSTATIPIKQVAPFFRDIALPLGT